MSVSVAPESAIYSRMMMCEYIIVIITIHTNMMLLLILPCYTIGNICRIVRGRVRRRK
jgi:hypothetical protein